MKFRYHCVRHHVCVSADKMAISEARGKAVPTHLRHGRMIIKTVLQGSKQQQLKSRLMNPVFVTELPEMG